MAQRKHEPGPPMDLANRRRQGVRSLITFCFLALVVWPYKASAQICVSQAPRYALTSDTVDWSITVGSGQGCVRGLRSSNVVLERVTLATPPKSGNVQLVGPGFRYTANTGFHGDDSFSVEVRGFAGKVRGTSTIRVAVSVKE
jgi:Bacterial Ig domain